MPPAVAATPADLTISPRNIAFGRGETNPRWWMGGDPVATAFYNVLSISFPQGESFFVESVRRFRDEAPPALKEQIAAFVKQEVLHTREHVAFNRQVAQAGYDTRQMEERLRERVDISRARHPVVQLAITMALEHFTAILAHALLADPRHLADAPPGVRRLWQWHAMEEIEHKGVAYDTFMHVTRDLSPFKRWSFRARVMLMATWEFAEDRARDLADLFEQDGIRNWKTWAKLLRFLLVKPGIVRKIGAEWLTFFRPGFHPWQHDDRALLAEAERMIGNETPAQAS